MCVCVYVCVCVCVCIYILISCGGIVEYHIVQIYCLDQNYTLLPKMFEH